MGRASKANCGLSVGGANDYRDRARELHEVDGEVAVDDGAPLSIAAPLVGAYVQAWVWVPAREKRFTVDGDEVDIDDFLTTNGIDPGDSVVFKIAALRDGQSMTLRGRDGETFILRRDDSTDEEG